MVEHVEQGLGKESVQTLEKQPKKRSQEDKIGRLKYHEVVTKRILAVQEQILIELRWMRHRLKALGEIDIDLPILQKYAVKDQVDLLIIESVRRAGNPGIFPKEVAVDIDVDAEFNKRSPYGLKYYQVSRRIVRMNKRLHFEVGEYLFEKRGHRWALTRFAFDVYGESERDISAVAPAVVDSAEDEGLK